MIKAENLSKTYNLKKRFFKKNKIPEKVAIQQINMDIKEGQIVGLLGINGAGKTTIIKMLSTMISPTNGQIDIDGIDAVKNPMQVKSFVNVITGGDRNIYWRLTARENLAYFGSLYGLTGKLLADRIDSCIETVGLEADMDIPVEKYSKGMKQRLQIARGLINNPKYIFLDEPTLGLDIVIARELREYIKILARKHQKGILLTTHYMNEVEELCDYVYILEKGKFSAQGTTEEIKSRFNTKQKIKVKFSVIDEAVISHLKQIPEVLEVTLLKDVNELEILSKVDIMESLITMSKHKQYEISYISKVIPTLEDSLYNAVDH